MPGETLRESLEASFDEHTETTQPDSPAPAPPAPAPAPAPTGDEPPAGDESLTAGRQRDEHGRFAREKADNQPAPQVVSQQPLPLGERPQPDPFSKAPQSWKPGAREAWANVPADVRAEIYRRERESERTVHEAAQSRQVATYVQRLQQQFAPALHAEGVDALTASANLMQLASRLRYGTPVEKAQLAAQIVRNYGVDVVALAAALDGQQYAQGQAPQQAAMTYQDPRVDQLLAQLQQAQTAREQQLQSRAVSDVESFGDGKDFFEDVRADMGDLMELAAKRGVDMSLDQAYERACAMNPEIAKVVAARGAARTVGNGNSSIQRARAAASSVRGTPNQVSTPAPTDLRGAIEAAIEQVGGR